MLIALALACEPKLLIADEPTTALDVMVQAQVLELLAELQRDHGLALLFITHDLSVLTSTCERLAVMYAGRIVEDGPSHDVFGDPLHPYSRGAGPGVPAIGDPASRMAPRGLRRRPAEPRRPARRAARSARAATSAIDECRTIDVGLRDAAATAGGRRASTCGASRDGVSRCCR